MTTLEYVLDGLEAALELERELGVRTIEIDRSLLATTSVPVAREQTPLSRSMATVSPSTPPQQKSGSGMAPVAEPRHEHELVFLHDRPLSPKGNEMMAKIISALGRTPENAPIIVASPVPKADIAVVLGGRALRRYFPEMKGEPGQWHVAPDGTPVLITYSPEYILRFDAVTPAVETIKREMWRSLKSVVQRLHAAHS